MIISRRHILLITCSPLFAALIVFWILHVPNRPGTMIYAIPPQATFVSAHYGLAERFPELVRNPLVTSLIEAMTMDEEAELELIANPDVQQWVDRLAAEETLLAYVPAGHLSREPYWLMTSWIGGRSQVLRWQLRFSGRHLDQFVTGGGTRIWTIPLQDHPSGKQLYVALGEGVAMLSLADNNLPMRHAVDSFERRNPDVKATHPFLDGIFEDTQTPDRAWFSGAVFTRIDLQELTGETIHGHLTLSRDGRGPSAMTSFPEDPVKWTEPMAFAMMSPDCVNFILHQFEEHSWSVIGSNALRHIGRGPLLLAGFDAPYESRMRGFRLPGYLIGRPVKDSEASLQAMQDILDWINSVYRAGLIAHVLPRTNNRIRVIEGVSDNHYATKPVNELLAYAVNHNWLLLTGGPDALRRVLDELFSTAVERLTWNQMSRFDNEGYAWIDIRRAAPGLRSVMAAAQLSLIRQDQEAARPLYDLLGEAREWTHALAPFGEARLFLRPFADGTVVIDFLLGH